MARSSTLRDRPPPAALVGLAAPCATLALSLEALVATLSTVSSMLLGDGLGELADPRTFRAGIAHASRAHHLAMRLGDAWLAIGSTGTRSLDARLAGTRGGPRRPA